MAIYAILELRLKPDSVDTAREVIHTTLAQTRAFEGSLGVDVFFDVADPAHVIVYERWASQEADDAYRAWRATPEGASGLGSVLAGAPVLTVLQLAEDV